MVRSVLNRRDTLRLATSLVAVPALSSAGAIAASEPAATGLAAAIRAAYADAQASRGLGLHWLEGRTPAMTLTALEAALRARGAQADAPVDGLGGIALRRWVANRIREDFAAGDVQAVDGWRLAKTEVLVCAVLAAA